MREVENRDFYTNILACMDDEQLLQMRLVNHDFRYLVDYVCGGNFFLHTLKKGVNGAYPKLFTCNNTIPGVYAQYAIGNLSLEGILDVCNTLTRNEACWIGSKLSIKDIIHLKVDTSQLPEEHKFVAENILFFYGIRMCNKTLVQKYWPNNAQVYSKLILGFGIYSLDLNLYYSLQCALDKGIFMYYNEIPESWIEEQNSDQFFCAAINSNRFDIASRRPRGFGTISFAQACNSVAAIEWNSADPDCWGIDGVLEIACALEDMDLETLKHIHSNVSVTVEVKCVYIGDVPDEPEPVQVRYRKFNSKAISFLIANKNWPCLDYAIQYTNSYTCNTFGEMLLLSKIYGKKWHPLCHIEKFINNTEFISIVLEHYTELLDMDDCIQNILATNPSWNQLKPFLEYSLKQEGVKLPEAWRTNGSVGCCCTIECDRNVNWY